MCHTYIDRALDLIYLLGGGGGLQFINIQSPKRGGGTPSSSLDQMLHLFSDEVLWSIFWFGYSRTYMHSLLTLTEMVLFKIVYIFKYSRIAAMNEYFLTFFITSFNFVVIFGFTIIRILLKEYAGTRRYFHQFAKPYEVYKKVEIP